MSLFLESKDKILKCSFFLSPKSFFKSLKTSFGDSIFCPYFVDVVWAFSPNLKAAFNLQAVAKPIPLTWQSSSIDAFFIFSKLPK